MCQILAVRDAKMILRREKIRHSVLVHSEFTTKQLGKTRN